ncbi:predicted protein [Sclerotinia sclerotiorum 1980 UF-70]|uniref:Uncharacterized protein n=1 Tax=Sclerotinia sclerotiorum (strain ATCC 18683 / 1980 / Ss-1) TaxID=665079 RepID=A7F6X7_SCLS1|nr:predicted protein [Sclerotinia sclerotiorum 1980 UF-70]EDN98498.1 predicted protein [Sclerotinia sclerotiorum 1980 UF-70]
MLDNTTSFYPAHAQWLAFSQQQRFHPTSYEASKHCHHFSPECHLPSMAWMINHVPQICPRVSHPQQGRSQFATQHCAATSHEAGNSALLRMGI